ncbi:hypothetical protein AA700_0050 [Acidiphilium acidophilum DSM 700]|nr:hypothetical protein AA700_0050 [Acidiphilium acidophilum DSM 700]
MTEQHCAHGPGGWDGERKITGIISIDVPRAMTLRIAVSGIDPVRARTPDEPKPIRFHMRQFVQLEWREWRVRDHQECAERG